MFRHTFHPFGKPSRLLPLLVAALPLASCSHEHVLVPSYESRPAAPSPSLRVGAARIEITPLPGYPMGGHSLGGRLSRGRWLPLYARAFYFQDSAGSAALIISCDLFAIPGGLTETVAQRLNKTHAAVSSRNLILAATHTHQGPGNFLSSPFYNGFASPLPGFDRTLFDHLADALVTVATNAVEDSRKPGDGLVRLGSVSVHDLVDSGLLPPFARNRAVTAFLQNSSADQCAVLYPSVPREACTCDPGTRPCDRQSARERGYSDRLSVLRLSRASGGHETPVGMLVFFGIHPTSLADHAAFYSSDFVGLAMTKLEADRQPGYVAAFFNGGEGDVSPDWVGQDVADVRRFAETFRRAVEMVTADTVVLEGTRPIRSALTRVPQRSFCRGTLPLMGVAAVGGAEDGRFVSFDLGWRSEDRRGEKYKKTNPILNRLGPWRLFTPEQKGKTPGLDYSGGDLISLTQLLAPPGNYPEEVPTSAVRLGGLTLVAVPFEMTSVAARHLLTRIGSSGSPTLLVGLANEYWSYVSSRAEWGLQDYEGASTLFGVDSEECAGDLALAAIADLGKSDAVRVPERDYDAGTRPLFDMPLGPAFWGTNPIDSDAGLESPFSADSSHLPWPRFEWTEERPGRAEVWQRVKGHWKLVDTDDRGDLLLEMIRGDVEGRAQDRVWNLVWLRPKGHRDDLTAFVVRYEPDKVICSVPFETKNLPRSRWQKPIAVGDCRGLFGDGP